MQHVHIQSPRRILAVLAAAAVATVGLVAPAVGAEGDLPVVVNPDFGEVSATGAPVGWGAWNPAGTATVEVEPAGGPQGGPAVSISATSPARYALTQRIAVDDDTPRRLIVTGMVKGEDLTGGLSQLRVQAFDGSGTAVVPVQKGPYLTGTFDWEPYTRAIELPDGATQLSIEPMLDQSAGTIWFTDIEIVEDLGAGALTATVTDAGVVELSWSFADVAADRYAVYRAADADEVPREEDNLIGTAHAPTYADDDAAPGTDYAYEVDALAADGTVLATSTTAAVTTPSTFTDTQQNTVLTALATADGAHVGWRLAAGIDAAGVTLVTGSERIALPGRAGTLELAAEAGDEITLERDGTTLASARVGAASHPRAILTPDVTADVDARLEADDPTTVGAWEKMMARIDGPDSGYITNGSAGLYRARDLAMAYAVTGEEDFAQRAFTSAMSAADFVQARDVNMGLELGRANLLLAPVYDWAYNGLDDAQRDELRRLMLRSADLLSTYHHGALDDADKGSNWVGVVRSTELALLLAARGDGDFGTHDARIAFLADEVAQHLDQAYTDSGYTQEGWDYLHYTTLYMMPSIYFAQGAGLLTLDEHLDRPDFVDLALHVVSFRQAGDVAQFGVSFRNGQIDGALPLFIPLADEAQLPGLLALYDTLEGVGAAAPHYDGIQGLWSIIYHPMGVSSSPADLTSPAAHEALLDDDPGFYAFRNRFLDADDDLVVTSNRNSQHRGWAGAETFSLSWIGHDTTWAVLGGKESTDPLAWSKPLVDGRLEPYADQYTTVRGEGRTLESRPFDGQGGGYLHLDGSANFEVDTADRQQVVDMAAGFDAGTIVAIHDSFADAASHEWNWQLRPDEEVVIDLDEASAATEPLFTFTGPTGAALSGFVPDRDGLDAEVIDGTLRLTRTGTSADFAVVLATSETGALTAEYGEDGEFVLDGRVIDLDALADTGADGLEVVEADEPAEEPTDEPTDEPTGGPTAGGPDEPGAGADGGPGATADTPTGPGALPETGAAVAPAGILAGLLLGAGLLLAAARRRQSSMNR